MAVASALAGPVKSLLDRQERIRSGQASTTARATKTSGSITSTVRLGTPLAAAPAGLGITIQGDGLVPAGLSELPPRGDSSQALRPLKLLLVLRREKLVWVGSDPALTEPDRPLPLILYPPPSISRATGLETLERAGRSWRIVCGGQCSEAARAPPRDKRKTRWRQAQLADPR
jgi:hypothetical protein